MLISEVPFLGGLQTVPIRAASRVACEVRRHFRWPRNWARIVRKCARFQQDFLAILKEFERIVVLIPRSDEAVVSAGETSVFRDGRARLSRARSEAAAFGFRAKILLRSRRAFHAVRRGLSMGAARASAPASD
jgi:hypothetical protein